MKEIFCKVNNHIGLTSRISAELVGEANRANKCNITLYFEDDTADLKSIMNMMSLVIRDGDEFIIKIEGENEELVCDKLTSLLSQLKLLK